MRILLLLTLSVLLAACGGRGQDGENKTPKQEAEGVVISQSQKGDAQWLLKAKSATFHEDTQIADLTRPELDCTDAPNASKSTIRANTGKYNMQEGLIALRGRVVAKSPTEKTELFTEEAFYDVYQKRITINVPVRVVRGEVVLNGAGLKATSDLGTIEVLQHTTQLPPKMQQLKEAMAK